jgi:DNA-binding LacI/PurR family transcriptional regulator
MNIYDLAREAGVSIATASKSLNGRRDVNEQTRAKVLEVAKRMSYHPSHLARGLARRRTENIGVVARRRFNAPFFTDAFYAPMMDGMELAVSDRGYNLLLSVLPAESGSAATSLPKMVREKSVDGLVLLGEMPHDLLNEVFERRIPCVIVDAYSPRVPAHYVVSDAIGGMQALVAHLVAEGHRSLAFVQAGVDDWSFMERQAGFEAACAELGLKSRVWRAPADRGGVEAFLRGCLQGQDRPSAVVAANDAHALHALRAALGLGLEVPRDLSVAGFDDDEAAGASRPALTTVRVDKAAMGRIAIEAVFKIMEPPLRPSGRTDLGVELVVRASTGPASAVPAGA